MTSLESIRPRIRHFGRTMPGAACDALSTRRFTWLNIAGGAVLVPELQRLDVVVHEIVDDGGGDLLLVAEVVVEQRPRHAAALADVLHRCGGQALLLVELPRRIDDLLPPFVAHSCHLPLVRVCCVLSAVRVAFPGARPRRAGVFPVVRFVFPLARIAFPVPRGACWALCALRSRVRVRDVRAPPQLCALFSSWRASRFPFPLGTCDGHSIRGALT